MAADHWRADLNASKLRASAWAPCTDTIGRSPRNPKRRRGASQCRFLAPKPISQTFSIIVLKKKTFSTFKIKFLANFGVSQIQLESRNFYHFLPGTMAQPWEDLGSPVPSPSSPPIGNIYLLFLCT